ncbi:hypothetical protein GALL_548760 [mine drainage metagenome]|uniref:Uncharacterized protein n=1 Tax=mine drainage metagenome TaxID=410659 RepID=A0A1J5NXS1_9ZZZZ
MAYVGIAIVDALGDHFRGQVRAFGDAQTDDMILILDQCADFVLGKVGAARKIAFNYHPLFMYHEWAVIQRQCLAQGQIQTFCKR